MQKIEHAGYTRYILQRNPRRYNEYGEEMGDDESDPEADADAEEENPYAGIRLEGAHTKSTVLTHQRGRTKPLL
jgi:hypothetical protein